MLSSDELYQKVERLRIQKGFSASAFNRLAGISHSMMNTWRDRGTYPRVDNLEGIAFALEIPLAELLYDVDADKLPSDEIELLSCWRELSEEQKKAITTTIKAMCKH